MGADRARIGCYGRSVSCLSRHGERFRVPLWSESWVRVRKVNDGFAQIRLQLAFGFKDLCPESVFLGYMSGVWMGQCMRSHDVSTSSERSNFIPVHHEP